MKRKLVVAAASLGLFVGTGGVAFADPGGAGPNDNANCNAILGFLNTHHPELVGGFDRSDISHLFKQLADESGIPVGDIFKFFAQAHLGDAVCD